MVQINSLTALKIKQKLKPGLYSDGLGLSLQARSDTSKSWIFRYRTNGKLRDMRLGPIYSLSLAKAREKAAACHSMRLNGLHPIEERRGKERRGKSPELAMNRRATHSNALSDRAIRLRGRKGFDSLPIDPHRTVAIENIKHRRVGRRPPNFEHLDGRWPEFREIALTK